MKAPFDNELVASTIEALKQMPQRGGYRCGMIDFPWWWSGGKKGRPQHYARMRDREIMALGRAVADLGHPEGCWWGMWCTGAKAPVAFTVARALQLRFSGRGFVWIKLLKSIDPRQIVMMHEYGRDLHTGMGFTTRKNAEDLWLFKTGKPKRISKAIHEVILSPLLEHSEKPDEAYARFERFCPGPRADIFARRVRPDWDGFGDQLHKFAPRLAA
jgi:N6-adenosine-specific RNA methylase IME4